MHAKSLRMQNNFSWTRNSTVHNQTRHLALSRYDLSRGATLKVQCFLSLKPFSYKEKNDTAFSCLQQQQEVDLYLKDM